MFVAPAGRTAPRLAHRRWILAVALLLRAATMEAQEQRARAVAGDAAGELARRVVAAAGGVRPGQMVVLGGGPHTIPLMEAVALEVLRAGGAWVMQLESERTRRYYNTGMPVEHLRINDSTTAAFYGSQLERADLLINFPGSQDPDALTREFAADTARLAAMNAIYAGTQERWDRLRNSSKARFVYVDFPPTRSVVARSGMDSASFTAMHLAAVTADPAPMTRAGRALARLLEGGKTVRVTTPAGTDLRMRLTGRRAAVDAGVLAPDAARARLAALRTVNLPGGTVEVAPLEPSVTGRVVLPRTACPGEAVVNARFEFRSGRLTGFAADSGGGCIRAYLTASRGGADLFGEVSIGLNPALRVVDTGVGYRPWAARGLVLIAVGNNTHLGGTNGAPAGHAFALTGATVEIDGRVVVRDGQLTDVVTASR
jgi:leucyl aminopeptidase (aminopeptidase T)